MSHPTYRPVYKALHRPLTICGVDRRLFFLAMILGAGTFNLGEAGLRCGEIMALEWSDVDLTKRQLCVARSEWKGHVTAPNGGGLRYVPLTTRWRAALPVN